ncbi:MAG TPA: ribonuclease HI family protein [Terracidiphilus sp.]|nr:ribonuclease HI family protein [Terracidiphilus sp.]
MSGNLFEDAGSGVTGGQGGWITAHCDGGSRGNPGPAGYGALITGPDGKVLARLSQFLGIQTNNFAEYSGLLAVLKWALENGRRRLRVVSDSELMVQQMKGRYKVNSPVLRPLWEEARSLSRKLEGFEITHTLRGGNKEADRLANEAMDRGMGKSRDRGTEGTRDQEDTGQGKRKLEGPLGRHGQPGSGQPKQPRQVLEGYVKGGVVHLLEGELPDGIFVKIVRE